MRVGGEMTDNKQYRPEPLPVQFDSIPQELMEKDQRVLWKYVRKEGADNKSGKWDKPPFTPTGSYAKSTVANTWSTFKK